MVILTVAFQRAIHPVSDGRTTASFVGGRMRKDCFRTTRNSFIAGWPQSAQDHAGRVITGIRPYARYHGSAMALGRNESLARRPVRCNTAARNETSR